MQIPVSDSVFLKDGAILSMVKRGVNKAKKLKIREEKKKELEIKRLHSLGEEAREEFFSLDKSKK